MNFRFTLTVFRAARDWRSFAVIVLATVIGAVVLGAKNSGFINAVAFYGPPLVAVAALSTPFEYSQRASVWLLIAQRPGTALRMMWQLLGTGLLVHAAASAVIIAGLVGGLAQNPEYARSVLGPNALMFVLWAFVAGCAVSVTSTLARAGSAAIAVAWFISPFVIAMLDNAIGFAAWLRTALDFLAPPFEAVFTFPHVLAGKLPDVATQHTLQLVWFPIYCFAILKWRLAVLAKPDQTRLE